MDAQRELLRLYAALRRGLREAQPWPVFFERFDLAKDWPTLERVSRREQQVGIRSSSRPHQRAILSLARVV